MRLENGWNSQTTRTGRIQEPVAPVIFSGKAIKRPSRAIPRDLLEIEVFDQVHTLFDEHRAMRGDGGVIKGQRLGSRGVGPEHGHAAFVKPERGLPPHSRLGGLKSRVVLEILDLAGPHDHNIARADFEASASKFLFQIVNRDLITIWQLAKPLKAGNIETDRAAQNRGHRFDAMPLPALVVARLRRQTPAVYPPVLLDVDEGIDVGADMRAPNTDSTEYWNGDCAPVPSGV